MSSEKIKISQEQAQTISYILQRDGVSQSKIEQIINGEYETYNTEYDLRNTYGFLKNYGNVLEKLADGYKIEELQAQGISLQKIQEFKEMLQERNLTVDSAKAIYQYSVGSNMILGIKRGTKKEKIKEQIIQDLENVLQIRGVPQKHIEKIKQFIKNTNYQETLHSNYDRVNQYMERIGLQQKARVSVRSAVQSMDRCTHIDETIKYLEEGLSRTNLPKSIKVYRAIKSSYLQKKLQEGRTLNSLVGKTISNNGQTSTSPLYDYSFAKYDDYDTVFEIYVPQGSRGLDITELSAYDNAEQEILLNPNDLYIIDVKTGVVDKNGRTKNILYALALSKDRECYKEVERNKDSGNKLPTKQNKFLELFNRIRAIFVRTKIKEDKFKNRYLTQKIQNNAKPKKDWELPKDQKTKIQKETSQIANEQENFKQQLAIDFEEKKI